MDGAKERRLNNGVMNGTGKASPSQRDISDYLCRSNKR